MGSLMLPTDLALSTIDLPPYAARGATEDITLIEQAGPLRRTINAILVDVSDTAFDKYRINVDCEDMQTPSFDGVRRGQVVIVNCISEFSYKLPGSANRPIAPGSYRERDGFAFYKPQLTCMVIDFETSRDEYGAVSGWSLELEEV